MPRVRARTRHVPVGLFQGFENPFPLGRGPNLTQACRRRLLARTNVDGDGVGGDFVSRGQDRHSFNRVPEFTDIEYNFEFIVGAKRHGSNGCDEFRLLLLDPGGQTVDHICRVGGTAQRVDILAQARTQATNANPGHLGSRDRRPLNRFKVLRHRYWERR
jgi:hypothetical protein